MRIFGWLLMSVTIVAGACSNGGEHDDDSSGGRANNGGAGTTGGAGTSEMAGSSASGGVSGRGGSSSSTAGTACSSDCDDHLPCTVDGCVRGACKHSIGPASGSTACPSGSYCTVDKGCVTAPACATNADCIAAWKSDPCNANPRCDAASSVCIFDVLDKDKDGHAPVVCGGDDCDDADRLRYPSQAESCNGADDDCDGAVDESEDGPCSTWGECVRGVCECHKENLCGTECAHDFSADPNHCGSCENGCGLDSNCMAGECICLFGKTRCGNACVLLSEDPSNCGGCGTVCGDDQECILGLCRTTARVDCAGAICQWPREFCVIERSPQGGSAPRCYSNPCVFKTPELCEARCDYCASKGCDKTETTVTCY